MGSFKKNTLIIKTILFIFILNFIRVPYYDAYDALPEKIKVGLYFASKAVSHIPIASQTGFQVGYEQEGEFISLFSNLNYTDLQIRKDAYFSIQGEEILEYSPEAASHLQGEKYGPIHIQLAGEYPNYDLAEEQVAVLKQKGLQAFPAYHGGKFKVWLGLYTSEAEAQSQIESIENTAGVQCDGVISTIHKGIQLILPGNPIPLLLFDSSNNDLYIQPIPSKDQLPLIRINGKEYRGGVIFKRLEQSDMTVINMVNIEEYLYGVVPREMSGGWPIEALKAQAVAARTYTLLNMNKYQHYGFNVCDTTASQVYDGYRIEHPNSTQAVNETRGKVLTYNGKPASIYYFSSSGGHTEDIRNVWGGPEVPYLKGVEDPYEPTEKAGRGIWSVELTAEEIEAKLKAKGYDLGQIISVEPLEYSQSGRVIKLRIQGSKGEEIFERDRTRTILDLNSQYYTVNASANSSFFVIDSDTLTPIKRSLQGLKVLTKDGVRDLNLSSGQIYVKGSDSQKNYATISGAYIFNGRGWGHGIGMSQWGAYGMAQAGFKYDEILTHYFPGTVVE